MNKESERCESRNDGKICESEMCLFACSFFQEVKEDNRVLQETKEVLEDQLEGWRARSDKIHQLEKHTLLLKARVHDMEQVRHQEHTRNCLLCGFCENIKHNMSCISPLLHEMII